ncbi:MAG TPA: MmgE/PrpD family protein [Chloroflexota bacterium]|nr:MmgE/PrpD family protein [Chloroflexota bacterium]
MTTLTERLAAWILELRPEELPVHVTERAKLLLLDGIGCALAALPEQSCQEVLGVIGKMGGAPECAVIGTPMRTSAPNAVLANAALMRFLDLNDMAWGQKPGGHPSDNMAFALAYGERERSSGLEVLGAIVVGYEIEARWRQLKTSSQNWDYSTGSSLAGPAMAGRLLRLDPERLANALGLSATFGPTLGIARAGHLSAAKWLASGMVGHTAMIAVELAAAGISGPRTALEGPRGWAQTVSAGADLEELVDPWGGHFGIEDASIKAFPSLATSQAAVAAALQVRQQFAGKVDSIERVMVRMADVEMVRDQVRDEARKSPASRETADHSFPFLIGVALMDGDLSLQQFENERWLQPATQAMMRKIEVVTDPALNRYLPGAFPAAIEVVLSSGERYRAEVPFAPGHHRGGLTAQHVTSKFDRYATPLSESRRAELKERFLGLESEQDLRDVMRLLALDEAP